MAGATYDVRRNHTLGFLFIRQQRREKRRPRRVHRFDREGREKVHCAENREAVAFEIGKRLSVRVWKRYRDRKTT